MRLLLSIIRKSDKYVEQMLKECEMDRKIMWNQLANHAEVYNHMISIACYIFFHLSYWANQGVRAQGGKVTSREALLRLVERCTPSLPVGRATRGSLSANLGL